MKYFRLPFWIEFSKRKIDLTQSLTVSLYVCLSVFLEDITYNILFCIVTPKLCQRQKGADSSLETTSSLVKASDTALPEASL
jgi:hypothetical protein